MNTYINTKSGEKAFLVNMVNVGTEKNIKPRMIMEGEKGRFFVEGEKMKEWEKHHGN